MAENALAQLLGCALGLVANFLCDLWDLVYLLWSLFCLISFSRLPLQQEFLAELCSPLFHLTSTVPQRLLQTWSLSSSPQATQSPLCQQTIRRKMIMVCSGSSIESLHVLGTLQDLLSQPFQLGIISFRDVVTDMSLEMHRLPKIRWLVSQNTSSLCGSKASLFTL